MNRYNKEIKYIKTINNLDKKNLTTEPRNKQGAALFTKKPHLLVSVYTYSNKYLCSFSWGMR